MKTKTRISLAAVATAASFAAGAAVAYSVDRPDRFGFSPIRDGIPKGAAHFAMSSPDLVDGGVFPRADICAGPETTPRLNWSGAPAGTQSFAVEMFDPTAPTGSGFSHWRVWDIPASAGSFDGRSTPPAGAVVSVNDGGDVGYDGPCPPVGDIPHHYKIRVFALNTPSIGLPANISTAVSGFVLAHSIIGFAEMTVTASQ